MCKAHVLRFSCGHGILMSLEPCCVGPCPMIKPTGIKLPQQPFRCYNCQHRLSSSSTTSPTTSRPSCTSSIGSLDSASSLSSGTAEDTTLRPTLSKIASNQQRVSHPLPGVAKQPSGSVQYCHNYNKPAKLEKAFTFSCSSSNHYPTPHYATLPTFLPHQDHACPPCQLECLRVKADRDITREATIQYPNLKGEMMVRNGRPQDEWEGKLTLEWYVDERRQEEKEMWLHVTRKWTQDLRKARVLVAEEDGLGLLA